MKRKYQLVGLYRVFRKPASNWSNCPVQSTPMGDILANIANLLLLWKYIEGNVSQMVILSARQ